MTHQRPTYEQLTAWAEDAFDFPRYWLPEHDGYVEAMAAELLELRRTLNNVVLEQYSSPPLGYVDTKPIGYVGATIGRILITTMMSSRREDLHTDRAHYEVWRADAFTPAKPAAYAVVFDGGGDPQIDTTSLDGSLSDAERRMHSWLSGDYQAYVVALLEVREVRSDG